MRGRLPLAVGLVLLFCGMCIIENTAVRMKPFEPADNTSSVYKLAGEFRTVFANLLWIKADKYHHEYIQRDPNWCNNKDLFGLFKMITALDPRFVEAYSTGTYILMNGYKDNARAMVYLRQGICNNRQSRELNELAAVLYAQRMKDPERALPYAQKAVQFAEDDWSRGVAVRTLHTIERMVREKKSEAGNKDS